jgi:uncharacterized Ntn-hydrolase superfamily protein
MALRGVAIIALALGIAVWLATRETRPRLDAPAVVTQVQRLNQLATIKYTVQKVVALEEQKYPVGTERILLILQADVTAGVDLAGLQPGHVTVERNGNVVIRLPQARILNVAVDDTQTRVWDRNKTWWTPWVPYSKDLEQRARIEGLATVRTAALEAGILGQAQRNAEDAIRGLLTLAGVPSVQVLPTDAS